VLLERAEHRLDNVGVGELHRGEVDGDRRS
jgi:hypothetical protein